MTWKTGFVQLLVTSFLFCSVCRVAESVAVNTSVTKPKHKGPPIKVFVTEIDASKFFKNRNTCSIVYCFEPRDHKQEEKERKEELRKEELNRKQEKMEEELNRKEEKREEELNRKEEKEEEELNRKEEKRERFERQKREYEERLKQRREEAREKWNERLEQLKQ